MSLPPIAQRKNYKHLYHSTAYEDPYHWLRQPGWTQETGVTDPAILDYIKAENAYTEAYFKDAPVQKFYNECLELVDTNDESYPFTKGNYAYFTKSLKGKNYQEYWRKDLTTGKDELLLDENKMAEGIEYFRLYILEASPDHRYIAIAFDQDGSERLHLKILDTKNHQFLDIHLTDVSGNGLVWFNDSSGFYFQKVDENWRSNQVYKFDFTQETLIFREDNVTNHVSISRSSDDNCLLIYVSDPKDSVVHVQDLNSRDVNLKTPFPRIDHIKFSLDSGGDNWFLLTNDKGPNKRLIQVSKNDLSDVKEIASLDPYAALTNFALYETHVAYTGRLEGLPYLKFFDLKTKNTSKIPLEAFSLDLIETNYDDSKCRINVSSLVKPETTILVDLNTTECESVKQKHIPGFISDNFKTKRHFATSKDGVQIPYTVAYKKGVPLGNAPVYLYGYGSYGYATDPYFRATFLPLLERGFVVVLAHIRGGGDLGRAWYEAAKLKTKQKTFDDFIACAEDLIKSGYTKPKQITIAGGSAGGLLVGATINQRPDLFKAAIAMVPFVDVINTMMDETLPLTPGEYHEWGNPQDKDYFDYMMTYSPYDNILAQDYPSLYITSGLNDPRVTYWEPTKWAAKLRHMKTDNNTLLLDTEMSAGHGGPSGKFGYLQEIAKRYAFLTKTYAI